MPETWTLQSIRRKFRELTGCTVLSDGDIDNLINDYYQNHFPIDSNLAEFNSKFSQETSATDTGEYELSNLYLKLDKPFLIDSSECPVYSDKELFQADYPETIEQYITAPALAIGTSSKTAVANSAFKYDIAGYRYAKAAAETELSGDTIPQDKYGAFCLKIDEDGDITVVEADDNATGYNSPRLAIEDMDTEDSDTAYMGFITVINTSGTFVPGTTELDAVGVSATYTDGMASQRGVPSACLVADNKLYVSPKPNDIFLITCDSVKKPDALSSDSSTISDTLWGLAVVLGTALNYVLFKPELLDLVSYIQNFYDSTINKIKNKKISHLDISGVQRNF